MIPKLNATLEKCHMPATILTGKIRSRLAAHGFLSLVAAFILCPGPCRAEGLALRLDKALQENAPKILDQLIKKNAETLKKNHRLCVGVLKFLVRKGKGKSVDNAGPLNLRIAERLEVALVLAIEEKYKGVRILHDVSGTVVKQKNRRANHLTVKGRQAFFDNNYSPAWGKEEDLPADVFLTGTIQFDDTFRKASITIEAFDKSGIQTEVCSFESRIDSRTLSEASVSYRSRGGSDPKEGETWTPDDVEQEMPIKFEILYDGKVVKIKNGTAPDPKPHQRVSLRLRHRNLDRSTFGVVLKVNGKNTILPEEKTHDDQFAWKWILKPESKVEVNGFLMSQVEDKTEGKGKVKKCIIHEFAVDPVRPTDENEVRYNEHAGTFQLVIYRDRPASEKEALAADKGDKKESVAADKADRDVLPISRGFPSVSRRAGSLKSLQDLLRGKRNNAISGSRGYIRPGDATKDLVEETPFKAFGDPVSSYTVYYYTPGKE